MCQNALSLATSGRLHDVNECRTKAQNRIHVHAVKGRGIRPRFGVNSLLMILRKSGAIFKQWVDSGLPGPPTGGLLVCLLKWPLSSYPAKMCHTAIHNVTRNDHFCSPQSDTSLRCELPGSGLVNRRTSVVAPAQNYSPFLPSAEGCVGWVYPEQHV